MELPTRTEVEWWAIFIMKSIQLIRNLQTCPYSTRNPKVIVDASSIGIALNRIIEWRLKDLLVRQSSLILSLCINTLVLQVWTCLFDKKEKFLNIRNLSSWFCYIVLWILSSPEVFTWSSTLSFLPSFYKCLFNFSARLNIFMSTFLDQLFQLLPGWVLELFWFCWTVSDRWNAT